MRTFLMGFTYDTIIETKEEFDGDMEKRLLKMDFENKKKKNDL